MSANLAMKIPAHLVEAANTVLVKRAALDPRQSTDPETYFLRAILRAIETDTVELGPKTTAAFHPRPS